MCIPQETIRQAELEAREEREREAAKIRIIRQSYEQGLADGRQLANAMNYQDNASGS